MVPALGHDSSRVELVETYKNLPAYVVALHVELHENMKTRDHFPGRTRHYGDVVKIPALVQIARESLLRTLVVIGARNVLLP